MALAAAPAVEVAEVLPAVADPVVVDPEDPMDPVVVAAVLPLEVPEAGAAELEPAAAVLAAEDDAAPPAALDRALPLGFPTLALAAALSKSDTVSPVL